MNIFLIILLITSVITLFFLSFKRFFASLGNQPLKVSGHDVLEIKMLRGEAGIEDFRLSALAVEHLFSSLHGLLREDVRFQEHFSLEMVSDQKRGIRFLLVVPTEIAKFVEGQVYAQFPTSQISVVSDYAKDLVKEGDNFEIATVLSTREDYYPFKSFRDFELDPLSNVTSLLSQVSEDEVMGLQFLIKPIPDNWQESGHKYVNSLKDGSYFVTNHNLLQNVLGKLASETLGIATGVLTGPFKYQDPNFRGAKVTEKQVVKLTPQQDFEIKAIENKLGLMGYKVELRVITVAKTLETAAEKLRLLTSSLKQFNSTGLNTFSSKTAVNKHSYLYRYQNRIFEESNAFILNVEELATLYHLPSGSTETPNIAWVYSRKTESPANLPTEDCVILGETVFRGKAVKFGIKNGDDRTRHMYVIGKSGTGKTTLFESMVAQDIKMGHGVGVLDSHGETIDKILDRIPDERIDDVIYFDPSDTERPIGLNLLQIDDPSQKNILASGLLAAIKQHFDYSWGPRLEYLLNYALLTLLEVPGTTMLGITRLMEDQNYQSFILYHVKDPVVRRFWQSEYKEFKGNQKLVTEAIAPIQNKVNRFLASSTIRNILGQKNSTINIWDAMQQRKILLMNLSKGKIGADNANLLGALLVSRIQFYALQRAKIPDQERVPFYLYVDEFQNFASGSFEEILSESRKYKLGLYLTHQFTAQLPEDLLKAVFGNVGTIATFSLGAPDARVLASEFAPYFDAEDIISLERFEIYIKMMIDGMTSLPFSGRILRPWLPEEAIVPKTPNREEVVRRSREKYGVDHKFVEDKLAKWLSTQFDKGMAIALENRRKKGEDVSNE